jgi:Na+-transporting NADH:ubiquinone oxidoreductase subunit C
VATLLCVVCSVFVSTAAVYLRPLQKENKLREMRRNILSAAGIYDPEKPLDEQFQRVETRLVDLETGTYVDAGEQELAEFDQPAAAKDPASSITIEPDKDLGGLRRRETRSLVYLVSKGGELDQIVLPVRGKGLWSTVYGFIAMDKDASTIRGITFYEHGETPGLGGEIDNPSWKAQWQDKRAFDDQGEVRVEVVRGMVDRERPEAVHQIDGLAGATITSRGVSNFVRYWLGDDGFGPFLSRMGKAEETERVTWQSSKQKKRC